MQLEQHGLPTLQEDLILILAKVLASETLFYLSGFQFPHLETRDIRNACFVKLS